jgi:nitrogen-specific signal transduction histidine kinase
MASEIAMVILARRFEARMADADKMRMAGMLASGVAHNFNNLLQAVMGQASLVEMQLPPGSPLVGSARMIIDAANRGASLINHLLNFSSKESRTRKHISLAKMLADSSEFYRSILGSEIALECAPAEDDLPQIYGDYSQLQQAITNLLVNSREAIAVRGQRDGRVRISTRKVRVSTGEIDPEMAPGNYVRIDIEDNGAGMDTERLARCFEPFYTTKNADSQTGVGVGGSGLGLSSAYSIIRQHDGTICAASQAGLGSTFTIYLPMIISHLKGAISADDTQLPLETVEVLTLALDEGVGSTVRSFMYSRGMRTYLAQKRVEAVQILKANAKSIRLVVLDVDKWGTESMTFIRGLLQENPEVVLVALTDQPRKWNDLLADLSGVSSIEKPLSIWSLHSIIKMIEGESGDDANESLAEQVDVELVESSEGFVEAASDLTLEEEAAGEA